MENTSRVEDLPREIIEMLLNHISEESHADLAHFQLINKNWSQPAQVRLYTSISLTQKKFMAKDQKKTVAFFKTITTSPSEPGDYVKHLTVNSSVLGFLSSTDYNDTSAKLEDLNLMFPNLEHLLKVGYEDVGLEDEYFSDDEEEVPGSITTMWNTVANKDHWHKLKEIPYGRKQLGYYGLGAYAHYQTFSVDVYYPYMGSLMNDGPTRFHEKASFCDNVVNKLQDYCKLKHLKFDVDPSCFSTDLKSLDYVIDKSASAVISLSLEQQDYHETEKTYSYPLGLIRVTNAEGYVDPQPKIKVLKNDLDLVFTGAVASYLNFHHWMNW